MGPSVARPSVALFEEWCESGEHDKLIDFLREPAGNDVLRGDAAELAGKLPPSSALAELLIQLLEDSSHFVRYGALYGLENQLDQEGMDDHLYNRILEKVESLSSDKNEAIRAAVAHILG